MLCQPSVLRHLLSIDKVGRCGVRAEEIALSELPHKARQSEERSFTLMSLRLDALCSGMFRISRTEAVRQIAAGNVSLNYTECLKGDRSVKEGGHRLAARRGQGRLKELGGSSRKAACL